MTAELQALLTHARLVPAADRSAFARLAPHNLPDGHVLVETCHRVEVYGAPLAPEALRAAPLGAQELHGVEVARHLVRLAVGRDSVVVAEDQILHQLRLAVGRARARGPVPTNLDRLFDVALRTGRRARSWLPGRRGSLVDVALHRVCLPDTAAPRSVLIVGAGEMGLQAAHALIARGSSLMVTSRTPERARSLAAATGGSLVPFDPGPAAVRRLDGVVVALRGMWQTSEPTERALVASGAWVVDLSAPTALSENIVRLLGHRLLTIDDLATHAGPSLSPRMLARLDELVEVAVGDYCAWSDGAARRAAARELEDRAVAARSAELAALWARVPTLEPAHRREVERMAHHLTERLLRDPLEQLDKDSDGRQARAARELFRL